MGNECTGAGNDAPPDIDRRELLSRLIRAGTVLPSLMIANCGGGSEGGVVTVPRSESGSPPTPAPISTTPAYTSVSLSELQASLSGQTPYFDWMPVFVGRDERSPRSGSAPYYRLPSLMRGRERLHAFAGARYSGVADTGEISMVWRSMGPNDTEFSAETILAEDRSAWGDGIVRRNNSHNACAILDPVEGDLHLLFSHMRGDITEQGAIPYSGDDLLSGSVRAIVSPDGDGATWLDRVGGRELSLPIQYSDCAKVEGRLPNWRLFMCGPGHGIATPDGMLIAPAWCVDTSGRFRAVALRYDRQARTWRVSGYLPISSSEVSFGVDAFGRLVANARDAAGGRVRAVSSNYGQSWSNAYFDTSYPDPACSSTILRVGEPGDANVTLWAHPAHATERRDLTVRLSLDNWGTYAASRKLYPSYSEYVSSSWEGKPIPPFYLNHFTAYSDLCQIDENLIGLLLEDGVASNTGGQADYRLISLIRFNLAWLLAGG